MTTTTDQEVLAVTRPHANLLKYYVLRSFLLGPLFPFLLVPLYLRYYSLRYRFDEEGVSMRWGILFRKEISLTYSRLQDIHLASNVVERWLDLARVQLQTASGSAAAEMTIEGLIEFDRIRDFLYSRMRGAREIAGDESAGAGAAQPAAGAQDVEILVETMEKVAAELTAIRRALDRRQASDQVKPL